jgi:hypothetical protein
MDTGAVRQRLYVASLCSIINAQTLDNSSYAGNFNWLINLQAIPANQCTCRFSNVNPIRVICT